MTTATENTAATSVYVRLSDGDFASCRELLLDRVLACYSADGELVSLEVRSPAEIRITPVQRAITTAPVGTQ